MISSAIHRDVLLTDLMISAVKMNGNIAPSSNPEKIRGSVSEIFSYATNTSRLAILRNAPNNERARRAAVAIDVTFPVQVVILPIFVKAFILYLDYYPS